MKDEGFEASFGAIKDMIRSCGAPAVIINSLVNLGVLSYIEPRGFGVFFLAISFSLFATMVVGETLFAFYGWRLKRELDREE